MILITQHAPFSRKGFSPVEVRLVNTDDFVMFTVDVKKTGTQKTKDSDNEAHSGGPPDVEV